MAMPNWAQIICLFLKFKFLFVYISLVRKGLWGKIIMSTISKLLNETADRGVLLFSLFRSTRFFSLTSAFVPTHNHIAELILDQKSPAEALQTFEWASKLPNFIHTLSTYRALIHKLTTFRQFRVVQQLLDEMPKAIGLYPDEDILITVARGYGRARMIRQVVGVLDLVTNPGKGNPSLKLLNSILDILVKENIDIAREFYRKKMMGSGVKGDDYTYGILMKGFCLTNRIGDGFKLLKLMKTHHIKVHVVVYNTLIHALCKNGKVGRARSLMNEMEDYSDVTYNILISAYCEDNNLVQALVMTEKCFSNGFIPDAVTLTKVVEILCNAERISEAVEVLERAEGKGGALDIVAYNTLLKGFVKAGKVRAARGFLKQMEMKGCLPNTKTYNVLIAGFCEAGMLDSAIVMFDEMKRVGVVWNFVTFDTLIHYLCFCGRTRDGFQIFELMIEGKGDFSGRITPYNSILYGLYKENRLDQVHEFLQYMGNLFPHAVDGSTKILQLCEEGGMEEAKNIIVGMKGEGSFPSAPVYASLIQGFCKIGCMKEALELMNEMIGIGYFPIVATFNGLIRGFCNQGRVGSALKLMEDLKMRGCLPDSGCYRLIMNTMCSQENLARVLKLLLEMVERGIAPDYDTWDALIRTTLKDKILFHELILLQGLIENQN